MCILLNDRRVISFICITEWDNHLYNMTMYFKFVQMFLDLYLRFPDNLWVYSSKFNVDGTIKIIMLEKIY